MSGSESQDHQDHGSSRPHKLFITGMDGKAEINDLEAELRKVFSKYGQLVSVVPKKSYNHAYSYAFIDFKDDVDVTQALKKENNSLILGSKITVTIQDNTRRRKAAGDGCFKCGKPGHFARDCRNDGERRSPERSDSRNRSDRKKKKKRRHSSDYSRSRSNSARKKQKRKRSKSRDKKHSKSKKSRRQRDRSGSPSN